ncbi:hypothetical protein SAMN04487905_101209 [Actinopolyspora xinjiangensis]|uniref:Uncharacterized protein n=1 Tax=Actinopolyspora xinjiangensis TaxID=405564 RepID=A0A1H0NPI4_9ACTN|nr:hypothetical protein [Actinopolyspora xinjiangensis]SDO94667.1 hypothetical protein SAMN04487905_101209 [Actinopolyspora xinjiangensis]
MATAVRIATFPFRVAWRLVKLLFLPVLITGLAWMVLGVESRWFLGIAAVCGVWTAGVVRLWWLHTVGELRSLGRGTVDVRTQAEADAGPSRKGRR